MSSKLLEALAPALHAVAGDLPAGLHFRAVRQGDGEALHATCYPHRDRSQFLATFRSRFRQQTLGHRLHLVAIVGETVVGNGHLIRFPQKLEIADLMVAPDWRSLGVGTAIIQIMVTIAEALGYTLVEIGVEHSNTRARDLYERLGFRPDRELKRPGQEAATILCKTLPQKNGGER